jgi:hypothetical protein
MAASGLLWEGLERLVTNVKLVRKGMSEKEPE